MRTKTFVTKPTDIQRQWWIVDAKGQTLGRLASQIAPILRGKHKPTFSTHLDTGDFVIVLNCDKIVVTGDRLETKKYYRHSGYFGNLREITLRDQLQKHPERALRFAIQGMLPKGPLGRQMLSKLKLYAGSEHPHQAQNPQPLNIEEKL